MNNGSKREMNNGPVSPVCGILIPGKTASWMNMLWLIFITWLPGTGVKT
jgi:hypothetical protein